MTNFERLKAMNIDEMAAFLDSEAVCRFCPEKNSRDCSAYDCREKIKEGLKNEAKE